MTVNEKIKALRDRMSRHNIDIYIVPTCDFHGSEYVGDYFKTREFISGFTGSAGTVVVTLKEAALKSGLVKEEEYDRLVDPAKMV